RLRYCNALKRGYAVDSGLRCGSNGSRDERAFANSANGVWAKTWRRKPLGVPTARGASQTRPPWPSLCRMLTLPSSDFRLWPCGQLNPPNRRMRTRMSGGVAGEAGRPVPLCRFREKHADMPRDLDAVRPARCYSTRELLRTSSLNTIASEISFMVLRF